jgi:CRISPR/Cas system-associated endonuclease Cas3-HD
MSYLHDELWEKCKGFMEHWEFTTPERRQCCLEYLEELKDENLNQFNTVLHKAKIIDTLIAVLNSRSNKEPIPEIYLKTFGELKE